MKNKYLGKNSDYQNTRKKTTLFHFDDVIKTSSSLKSHQTVQIHHFVPLRDKTLHCNHQNCSCHRPI